MPSVELVQGNPIVVKACDDGGADFQAGDLVQFDSSGLVSVGATTSFCAIARKACSAVSGTATEIEMISPYNLYRMVGVTGTALAQTDVGDGFVVTFTEGAHYITVGTDSDGAVWDLEDAIGTDGGRYLVQFFDSVLKTGVIG